MLGSFKRVVSAITIAKEVGFESLSVAFSPTQFNFRQFANTVDCLVDLGVTNVRMQPLMGLGRGRQSQNIFMKPEEYRDLLRSVALLRAEYPDIRIEWGDPIDHLLRFAETLDCAPFLSISSIGNICLSPYLPIMLGNVRRHTLLDYWNGGIWKCWQIALFRDIVSFYTSAVDLSRTDVPAPNADFFESVGFDIIDDMIADLSFERMNVLYWNRFKECIAHSSRNGEAFIGRCISLAQTHPRLAPSEIKRLVDGAARWPSRRYDAHMSLYSLQPDGLSYEICSESALRDIMCFLSKIKKQNLIEADGFDSIGYVSPNFDLDNIGVADLRMHIFNCSWIFFSVRSQRDGFVALGMVEVRNGFEKGRTLLSNAGVLQFLLVYGMNECETNDIIERLEKFIERNLRCASIIATPKLHVLVESADAVKSGIADILCRRNFFREVASGHDGMVLYSKFLP